MILMNSRHGSTGAKLGTSGEEKKSHQWIPLEQEGLAVLRPSEAWDPLGMIRLISLISLMLLLSTGIEPPKASRQPASRQPRAALNEAL